MTPYSLRTQAAILKWVNTFDTPRKAGTLQDLRDGVILAQILEKMMGPLFNNEGFLLDPRSAEDEKKKLTWNPRNDDDGRKNLKIVHDELSSFLRIDNPLLALTPSEFRAIAENPSDNALCDLLSAFLTAACMGTLSQTYVPVITSELDPSTQKEIMMVLDQKIHLREERESRDLVLMEEELDTMKDKVDTLKKQNADLQSRLDKMLDNREALLRDLQLAQDELSAHKRAKGSDTSTAIRELRNEVRDKMTEIDRLEDLLEKEMLRCKKLEKENESFQSRIKLLDEMQDKVTLLEHETKQQQQMIKGLENYKKKAQDLAAIQQRNRALEEHIQGLEQEIRDYEEVKEQNRKLQKEMDEKVMVLSSNEQEIIYTLQSKNVLQDANEELKRKVEYLESKRQLDEATIRELQEQLQLGDMLQLSGSDSPGPRQSTFNLEQELDSTNDPTAALRLEVQRLKAENNLLRNNMAVGSENERLRTELDVAHQKVEHYRLTANEAMEKHAVVQEQVTALMTHATTEGDVAFVNMRQKLSTITDESEQLKKRIQELEREASDRGRELIQVKTDLDNIGEEQSTVLAALKSSDELISDSLRTELEATRKKLNQKTFELEQMKEQLMGALLSKDKIQKKLEEALASAVTTPPNGQTEEVPAKSKKEDAEKIEKLKSALRQKIEQLEKAEQDKYELQRRIKAAENGTALAAQKAANEQIIKTLQRENAMITTAWYDLTSRLQSNHMVLARRHDAPKSWLNRQRQMVNGKFFSAATLPTYHPAVLLLLRLLPRLRLLLGISVLTMST
ncbi:protein hook [Cladorrhinum sp. PSN332]|nr:protein hook [Cladorrhinum sp. PSN332]